MLMIMNVYQWKNPYFLLAIIKLFNPICNIKKTIEEEYRIKNYNNNSIDMFLRLY